MNDDAIRTTLSEKLDYTLEYEEGFSLAGATLRVVDYHPAVLSNMRASATDERTARLELDAVDAAQLGVGKTSHFRLEVVFPDGGNDVTPPIWIHVV